MPDVASGLRCLIAILALAAVNVVALAAGPRMYVASSGADGNPCTTSAPCRTLQYAVSSVDPSGEVIVLDSGGFGPVAIAKSVSIIAPAGIHAGITVQSGAGVDVNGAGIKVALNGLTVTGLGAGTTGVRFAAGADLRLVRCRISAISGTGLAATAADATVLLRDTTFNANGTAAAFVGVSATLVDVHASNNGTGLDIGPGSHIAVRGGSFTGAAGRGIVVTSLGGIPTTLAVDSAIIAQNATGVSLTAGGAGSKIEAGFIRSSVVRNVGDGIIVDATSPATAVVTLTKNDISDQVVGVRAQNSGVTLLASGNTIARNTTNGLVQLAGATVQSLVNNTIDPALSPPTAGTITAVSGY